MAIDYGINISEFTSFVASQLRDVGEGEQSFNSIADIPIVKGKQCLYVMNWQTSEMTYCKGIEEMLGYNEDEFNFELVLKYSHPDDLKFVNRIIKGAIEQSIKMNVSGQRPFLNLTHRVQRKDGTYLKVLRRSIAYEVDSEGKLISNFSLLTDISFISNNDKVEWDIYLNGIDTESFNKAVHKEFVDFFTQREKEIISLISKGYKSSQIASDLKISNHTVFTHRKNILRKANCHSRHELLSFCVKNGIL